MVFTGDGKGKTTAALGQVLRAVGHGQRCLIIQFLKGDTSYGEVRSANALPGVELIQCGLPTYTSKENPSPMDFQSAADGLQKAANAIASGKYALVVLDEANIALDFGLIPPSKIVEILRRKPDHTSVILTGRTLHPDIAALADTITEMQEVKHHWRSGVTAQAGIEF